MKINLRNFVFFYSVKNNKYDAVGNIFFKDMDSFPSKNFIRNKAAENESKFTEEDVIITGWKEMNKKDFEDFTKFHWKS